MKIPFAAATDGRIVEAVSLEEGAPGPFFCAACRSAVILKQGRINVWHFAHRPGSDCTTGFETALHLLAKQILVEARHLQTPALRCQVQPSGRSVTLRHAQTLRWSEPGEVEKWLDGFHPDFVLLDGTPLIVEVAVTHFCGDDKCRKLSELGIPAIEINLSDVARDITERSLKELVLDNLACKRWIYHAEEAETLRLMRAEQAEAEARIQRAEGEAQARRLLAVAKKREDASRDEQDLKDREIAQRQKIQEANRLFRGSSNEHKLAFVAKELGVYGEWPTELDVNVRWASVMGVPRRIWQGDVFRRHLFGKYGKRPTEVSVDTIATWLTEPHRVSRRPVGLSQTGMV